MTSNVAQQVQIKPSLYVARWKLSTAIAVLISTNTIVPVIPLQLNIKVKGGTSDVSEETLLSAYKVCCAANLGLVKQIDRLGYLRFELLSLLELAQNNETDDHTVAVIVKGLAHTPLEEAGFIQCEIELRQAIHLLMPDEQHLAKINLYSKTLRVRKGELSNHIFHLIKLGRSFPDAKDRMMVENLIENQLALLGVLTDNITPVATIDAFGESVTEIAEGLSKHAKKQILKVVHWQPKDLEDANKIYAETKDLLARA